MLPAWLMLPDKLISAPPRQKTLERTVRLGFAPVPLAYALLDKGGNSLVVIAYKASKALRA